MRRQDGFTLVELLVVVIVIGILAAIAIPQFLGQRESAWQAAAITAVRNAIPEAEAYFAETGEYPADAATFTSIGSPGVDGVTVTFTLLTPTTYRIDADHVQLPNDVDAFFASTVGRIQVP